MPITTPPEMHFELPDGTPIANGTFVARLSTDAVTSSGQQISAGRVVKLPLDVNGDVVLTLFPNADLTPSDTIYFAKVYDSRGALVWQQEIVLSLSGIDYLLQSDDVSHFLLAGSLTDAILLAS